MLFGFGREFPDKCHITIFSLVGISAHLAFVLDLFGENSRVCATQVTWDNP